MGCPGVRSCLSADADPFNCGACGHACSYEHVCLAGACVCSVPGAVECPDGTCQDILSSSASCGACGHACGAKQACVAGVCTCPAGMVECSPGFCANLQTNADSCGACGHVCPPDQGCSKGTCAKVVCEGLHLCDCGVEVVALDAATTLQRDLLPSINRHGTVAYADDSFVYSFANHQLVATAMPAGTVALSGTTSINATGQIAFTGLFASLQRVGVYRADGGAITRLAPEGGDLELMSGASIDGAGHVAFGGYQALFITDGTTRVPLDETTSTYDRGPVMNEAGDVAIAVREGGWLDIVSSSGGVRSVVASPTQDNLPFAGPALNDAGAVAFLSILDAGSGAPTGGLLISTGGVVVQQAALRTSDYYSAALAMDETGTVALDLVELSRDLSQELVLALPDGTFRPILRTGDPMFRSTVAGIGLSPFGFRGQGQLAFGVSLEDGRSAIIRVCVASP